MSINSLCIVMIEVFVIWFSYSSGGRNTYAVTVVTTFALFFSFPATTSRDLFKGDLMAN